MLEWLASLRTTNGMRLPFPEVVSSRTKWARYKPDTALDAIRLRLRGRGGRLHVGDHLAGAVALVVPDPQDVDVVRASRSVDLEVFGLAHVDAHRRGKALDRWVSRAAHLPVTGRVAGQRVLTGDHADHGR